MPGARITLLVPCMLSHHLLLPRYTVAGAGIQTDPGLQLRYPDVGFHSWWVDVGFQSRPLNTVSNTCSFCYYFNSSFSFFVCLDLEFYFCWHTQKVILNAIWDKPWFPIGYLPWKGRSVLRMSWHSIPLEVDGLCLCWPHSSHVNHSLSCSPGGGFF